jgi:hypothetical protein
MQTFNLEQLKAATLSGGVTDIILRGDGDAFVVNIQTQRGDAVMVTSRKQPRRFADPRKALQVLRGLGWLACRVDLNAWQPEVQPAVKKGRPDRSIALKSAHLALQQDTEYDRWFHGRVQASLAGLKNGSNPVLDAAELADRRAALQARVKSLQSAPGTFA